MNMMTMKWLSRTFVAAAAAFLIMGGAAHAQAGAAPPDAPAATAQAAPAPDAAPAPAAGAPAAAAPAAAARFRRHSLDDHIERAGADDDHSWPCALLRRHGAQEERARHAGAKLRGHLHHHRSVDDHRLLDRLHDQSRCRGQCVHRQRELSAPRTHGPERDQFPGADHSRVGLHVLPDDLRDHHPRAHCRGARGPHEVFGVHVVHVAMAALRLLPDRALGLGRRLARCDGRSRLRRRHGRPLERWDRGPRHLPRARQARRLRHREHGAAQSRA